MTDSATNQILFQRDTEWLSDLNRKLEMFNTLPICEDNEQIDDLLRRLDVELRLVEMRITGMGDLIDDSGDILFFQKEAFLRIRNVIGERFTSLIPGIADYDWQSLLSVFHVCLADKQVLTELILSWQSGQSQTDIFSLNRPIGSVVWVYNADSTIRITSQGILGFLVRNSVPVNRIQICSVESCKKLYWATRLGSRTGKMTCSKTCSSLIRVNRARAAEDPTFELKREIKREKRRLKQLKLSFSTTNPKVQKSQQKLMQLESELQVKVFQSP